MRHKRLEKDFDNAVGFLQEFLYGFGFGSRILEVLGGGGVIQPRPKQMWLALDGQQSTEANRGPWMS